MGIFDGLAVGFDIDGTITDDNDPGNIWDEEMLRHFGVERRCNSYDFCEAYGLTPEEVAAFCDERLEEIFRVVPIKPDCVRVVSSLRLAGVKVHLITARQPRHSDVTARYLAAHGLLYDSLLFTDDKVEACLKLGISFFADDKTENCVELRGAGIDCVMVDAFHNAHVDYKPRVKSWSDIELHVWSSLRQTSDRVSSTSLSVGRLA